MIAASRTRRAQLRTLTADVRSKARARRRLTGAIVAPASLHLVDAGVPIATVDRFKSAFSRGLVPAATRDTKIKLRGRTTKIVKVKLYDVKRIHERLATYRPRKDAAAAAIFARVAATLLD
jgi:hypothetical protein